MVAVSRAVHGRTPSTPMPVPAIIACLALIAAVLAGVTSAVADEAKTFTAPFDLGPRYGDMWNHVDVDPEAGSITILRVYPDPGRIASCPGKSGMAHFRVQADGLTASEVTATAPDVLMDGYTFLTLTVRDARGEYLGATELRGPLLEGVDLTVDLPPAPADATERALTIDFGMKVASACPNVDGGTVTFDSLVVR